MCVSSWIVLISINGSRKINSRGRGRLSWSFKIEGILGQTDTTITGIGGTLLGNLDPLLLRWLARCFGSQYIKSWKKSRMSHTLNDQIRWEETPQSATKAFIANTNKSEDTTKESRNL